MPNLPRLDSTVVVFALCLLGGCSSPDDVVEPGSTGAKLYDGFDGYHRTITTDSEEAQRWFDQGLRGKS